MSRFDYDLIVIGAGSGGVRSARMAAGLGQRVAVIEEKYLGGTCVNVGCVPKKLLVYAAQFAGEFEDAAGFGWQGIRAEHDWPTLIANKDGEISRLNGIYQAMLENAGVTIIRGRGRLQDGHSVAVNGETLTAEKILLAVGCTPSLPAVEGIEHTITSDQAFYLEQKPARIAIVGGGYIAVEFAGIFNGLGSETHLLYRAEPLLRHFDNSIARFVSDEIGKKGVNIHYHSDVRRIEKRGSEYCCHLQDGRELLVDQVMYATGRHALSADLGLENTAVTLRDNGSVIADAGFQTAEPSVYALGDMIGTPELTPVALAQAMVFVDQQYGSKSKTINYDAIPTAVFCQPNIASVGLTEQQVNEQKLACDVYRSEFRPLRHTLSGSDERMMLKMLVERDSDKLLGVHVAGEHAAEIMQGFAVAVKAGLKKAQLDATIGIHPTAAEELVTMREVKYTLN